MSFEIFSVVCKNAKKSIKCKTYGTWCTESDSRNVKGSLNQPCARKWSLLSPERERERELWDTSSHHEVHSELRDEMDVALGSSLYASIVVRLCRSCDQCFIQELWPLTLCNRSSRCVNSFNEFIKLKKLVHIYINSTYKIHKRQILKQRKLSSFALLLYLI